MENPRLAGKDPGHSGWIGGEVPQPIDHEAPPPINMVSDTDAILRLDDPRMTARRELIEIHLNSWLDHDKQCGPWMVDAILANPDVALRALIEAHGYRNVMDVLVTSFKEARS